MWLGLFEVNADIVHISNVSTFLLTLLLVTLVLVVVAVVSVGPSHQNPVLTPQSVSSKNTTAELNHIPSSLFFDELVTTTNVLD